jgi:hypothetical protein
VPKARLPLVGVPNQRNYDSLATLILGKDQRFRAGIIGLIQNPFSNSQRAYFEKRPGFETHLTPGSGKAGQNLFYSRSQDKFVSSFSTGGETTVYVGTTSCGTTA